MGPNVHVPIGFAPLRRQVCIRRKTEEIHVDDWQAGEHLSQRGLRKKGVPARFLKDVTYPIVVPDGRGRTHT